MRMKQCQQLVLRQRRCRNSRSAGIRIDGSGRVLVGRSCVQCIQSKSSPNSITAAEIIEDLWVEYDDHTTFVHGTIQEIKIVAHARGVTKDDCIVDME
jgi:hypothetical protein